MSSSPLSLDFVVFVSCKKKLKKRVAVLLLLQNRQREDAAASATATAYDVCAAPSTTFPIARRLANASA